MSPLPRLVHVFAFTALAAASLAACETYDPPPETAIVQPVAGTWNAFVPIEFTFSEPIARDSLVFDIRRAKYDIEGNFEIDVPPLISGCTLATQPCSQLAVALDNEGTRLTLTQNDAFASTIGEPLVMVVHGGLADTKGRMRDVPSTFDFQINPPACDGAPLDLDLGLGAFSLAASLEQIGLNGIYLRMVLDMAVDNGDGTIKVIGTFARLKLGDVTYPANYSQPDGYVAELGETSWVVTFDACALKLNEGQYFLQSDPFDVSITLLNVIPITLTDFRVQGTLRTFADPATRATVSGTLSTSGGTFGNPPTTVNPITTAWDGAAFIASEIDPGLPQVCKEAPCTVVDAAGGDCQVPVPWDNDKYCE